MKRDPAPVEILLVEDNPDDLELALDTLKTHEIATHIQVARDGVEALDFMFAKGTHASRDMTCQPHVVLLDLKLPRVNGLEVLRQLKGDPRTQATPVVVMTTSNQERDMVESYRLGVNSYVVKPIDFEQFTEAMRLIGSYWLRLNEPLNA